MSPNLHSTVKSGTDATLTARAPIEPEYAKGFLRGHDEMNAVVIPRLNLPVPKWCALVRRHLDGDISAGPSASAAVKERRAKECTLPNGT